MGWEARWAHLWGRTRWQLRPCCHPFFSWTLQLEQNYLSCLKTTSCIYLQGVAIAAKFSCFNFYLEQTDGKTWQSPYKSGPFLHEVRFCIFSLFSMKALVFLLLLKVSIQVQTWTFFARGLILHVFLIACVFATYLSLYKIGPFFARCLILHVFPITCVFVTSKSFNSNQIQKFPFINRHWVIGKSQLKNCSAWSIPKIKKARRQ